MMEGKITLQVNPLRNYVALRSANDITSIVKHNFGTVEYPVMDALVFNADEQKVEYTNGVETRRYAYHMTENGKHGVEEILHCQLRDAEGIAKLIRAELEAKSIACGSCRKEYQREADVNHFYFDIIFLRKTYEVGVHLAKADSLYAKQIGCVNATCIEEDTGNACNNSIINNILKKYCL